MVLSSTVPELAGGGDRAAALRTLDHALLRKPGDPSLAIAQAQVHMQIADFQRASALLDGALAGPTTAADRRAALFVRGHANFDLGRYVEAADDFEASLEGRTSAEGAAVAAAVALRGPGPRQARRARGASPRNSARRTSPSGRRRSPSSCWASCPAGELEVAAETDDAAKRSNGKCPSAFFMGIDAIRRGDKQRAREQLQLAQARCPTVSEFNWAAASELKRL